MGKFVELKTNDTLSLQVTRSDADGNAVDLTGMAISAAIRLGSAARIPLTVTVVDAANGTIKIALAKTDTASLDIDEVYACDIRFGIGSEASRCKTFYVKIIENVTDEP